MLSPLAPMALKLLLAPGPASATPPLLCSAQSASGSSRCCGKEGATSAASSFANGGRGSGCGEGRGTAPGSARAAAEVSQGSRLLLWERDRPCRTARTSREAAGCSRPLCSTWRMSTLDARHRLCGGTRSCGMPAAARCKSSAGTFCEASARLPGAGLEKYQSLSSSSTAA